MATVAGGRRTVPTIIQYIFHCCAERCRRGTHEIHGVYGFLFNLDSYKDIILCMAGNPAIKFPETMTKCFLFFFISIFRLSSIVCGLIECVCVIIPTYRPGYTFIFDHLSLKLKNTF